jgi:hypothetical protein
MNATPSGSGMGGIRSAMIAAAPEANASPTKRKPSSYAPATATNRSPGLTVRLSVLMPASSSAAKRASLTASRVRISASFRVCAVAYACSGTIVQVAELYACS